MSLRFNKTFHRFQDPVDVFKEQNPVLHKVLSKEKITLVEAYQEKNVQNIGFSVTRWRFKALIFAPLLMYGGLSLFTYTDPIQKRKNQESDDKKVQKEKEILQEAN